MNLRIEETSIWLVDALYDIEKKCFVEEAFSRSQIGDLLADYNSIGLVARLNGEIVGFIIGRIEIIGNQHVGHVMTIDVSPAYRRKKIGQRLMLEMESIFKQKGATEFRLEVRKGNTAALDLYKKLGYRKVAVLENYYGKTHGFYLRKNLL